MSRLGAEKDTSEAVFLKHLTRVRDSNAVGLLVK